MTAGRRPVLWSPEALADLDAIWDYYARAAGAGTADKLVREIVAMVRSIETHPRAGRSRDELRPGIRSIAASPHVVFYRLVNNLPQVVRVLDGRRDLDEIFTSGMEKP
jgi:toxin ParE1/3/4